MNKTELITIVHNLVAIDHPEVSKKAIAATLETLSDVILATVSGGGEVVLPNVAKIALKSRDARVGRNPRTGETVQIPAKRVLKFTPAKALKDAVAEQDAALVK